LLFRHEMGDFLYRNRELVSMRFSLILENGSSGKPIASVFELWRTNGARLRASERFFLSASIPAECGFCSLAFGGRFCYLRMFRDPPLKN
jgi:hypothetical protein